jgi:SAM-dependent methyltransferase
MHSEDRQKKWQQRYLDAAVETPTASGVLADNVFLLPKQGRALDLACGRGGNALLLARCGLRTEGWDYAPAAIDTLNQLAKVEGLPLKGLVRDVEKFPPEPSSFDIVTVSYFLDRAIIPNLIRALRQGGLIFYETWLREALDDCGPSNEEFRLGQNELLHLFNGLQVLSYQEHGLAGDPSRGIRNVARLVACA